MSKKLNHINNLLFIDVMACKNNIEAIESSDYSNEAETILAGYYRKRIALNNEILNDNGFFEERNINTQTPEENAN